MEHGSEKQGAQDPSTREVKLELVGLGSRAVQGVTEPVFCTLCKWPSNALCPRKVEYFSATHRDWLPAVVINVDTEASLGHFGEGCPFLLMPSGFLSWRCVPTYRQSRDAL